MKAHVHMYEYMYVVCEYVYDCEHAVRYVHVYERVCMCVCVCATSETTSIHRDLTKFYIP